MSCLFCNLKNKLKALKNNLINKEKDIDEKLNSAFSAVSNAGSQQQSFISMMTGKLKSKMASKVQVFAKSSANKKLHSGDKKQSDKHNMQDAKKDIVWHPMTPLKVYYTKIKKMKPASYSNAQNYPKKIGHIDEMKNFEVKNHSTGEWWRVHHTGYYQKVDGVGNYEEKIPGTSFYYIFKDLHKSVEGNVDYVYKQNYYHYTMMDKTEDIDGNHYLNNHSNYIISTLASHNEVVGALKTVHVGGPIIVQSGMNITIKAAGNITIQAGGTITLKGAKINLN